MPDLGRSTDHDGADACSVDPLGSCHDSDARRSVGCFSYDLDPAVLVAQRLANEQLASMLHPDLRADGLVRLRMSVLDIFRYRNMISSDAASRDHLGHLQRHR
jgi:hypothetical protein